MNIKRKSMYFIGSALVVISFLSGCASSEESSATKEDNQVETKEPNVETKVPTQNIEEKTANKENVQPVSKEVKDDHVIEISAFEMGYTPPSITLEEGIEYTLILKNEGKIFHDLTAKELDVEITHMGEMPNHPEGMSFIDNIFGVKTVYAGGNHKGGHEEDTNYIHMNANPDQTVEIKFIPKETGKFKFNCSVPGHTEAGMHGDFEVK